MGLASRREDREGAGMTPRIVQTTITYLAMEAKPAHLPPLPSSPRLAIMKAEKIPLHFYRYLYETVGGAWLWIERLHLDDEALARKVHREGIEIYVLYANGAPAGYYELDFGKPKRTNLAYFGLMPEWTGFRIGPWFLGSAITTAFSRGAEEVTVNTCTLDHPAALPLYQKLGFKPVRREERQLAIPSDIAIPGHIAARIAP
jgi:GNAT superfamily N-acetyltransferase